MIKVAILGDIGSGKTFVSNKFGYPVFNADKEVANIYKKNKACFLRLKKKFPKFINTYPIDKNELKDLILKNSNNIKKISKCKFGKVPGKCPTQSEKTVKWGLGGVDFGPPGKCQGHVQKISRKVPGHVREMSGKCPEMFGKCPGNVRESSWKLPGYFREFSGP